MKAIAPGFFCTLLLATAVQAETATLKMRFVFDGDAPTPEQIAVPAAAIVGPIVVERFLVDPASKGIRNVVVYLDTGRRRVKLTEIPQAGETRRLTMINGRFEPRILIARAGDTLELINDGPIAYRPIISFFNNPPWTRAMPVAGRQEIPVVHSEPAPIPVDCDINPWMEAYVVVLNHPFAAVSDKDGAVTIEGLPVRERLTFRVFHEEAVIDSRRIDRAGPWSHGRLEIELFPGINDFGDVPVPADALSRGAK